MTSLSCRLVAGLLVATRYRHRLDGPAKVTSAARQLIAADVPAAAASSQSRSGERNDNFGVSSQAGLRVTSRTTLTGLVVPHRVIPYALGDKTIVAW